MICPLHHTSRLKAAFAVAISFSFYILAATRAQAQSPLVLQEGRWEYTAEGKAAYLIDDQKTLTLTDVSSSLFAGEFHVWEGKTVNVGYRPAAVWVRLVIHNQAPDRSWLIKTDVLDDVRVFFPDPDGGYRPLRLGRKMTNQDVLRRFGFFYIEIPKSAGDKPIFLRYEHDDTMVISLGVQELRTLLNNNEEAIVNGFFIGLIAVLVIYNLLLFLYLKDSSYIYYSIFIFSMFMLTLIFSGIILNALPPGSFLSVDKLETIALSIALASHIMFMRKYLLSDITGPKTDRALLVLAVICIAHIATIFFVPYLVRTLSLFLSFVVTLCFNVVLVVDCIRRSYTPVRFFITAWLVLVGCVVVFTLRSVGVLGPSLVTDYSLQVGTSLEALLLAFGLAFRINVLQKERDRADEWGRTNLARAERMQQDYQRLFETAPLGIALFDLDGRYVAVNESYCRLYEHPAGELKGKCFYAFVYQEERTQAEKLYWDTIVAGPKTGIITFERTNLTGSGKRISVRYFLNFTRTAGGDVDGVLCCVEDVTGLKQALDELRSSVLEKELLLKEVHHRVKNNMQIIISLFRLKSRETEDRQVRALLESTESRIRAIANVHNRIYLSKDVARVDAETFIPSTVKQALSVFHLPEERCTVVYAIDPIRLTVDIALPLSLILNELVTNSVTHGYNGTDALTIKIGFRTVYAPDGRQSRVLEVADTGRGFPEGFPVCRFETFGLGLVETLSSQLDGTLTLETVPHTRIAIRFAHGEPAGVAEPVPAT
jgi:PAS domain S-box-containing protein